MPKAPRAGKKRVFNQSAESRELLLLLYLPNRLLLRRNVLADCSRARSALFLSRALVLISEASAYMPTPKPVG